MCMAGCVCMCACERACANVHIYVHGVPLGLCSYSPSAAVLLSKLYG